ncbi:MAG: ABC transporter permease [Chloroflexi bacterium]|nr:ABC transporter permease [Chloroflexota bacterium]
MPATDHAAEGAGFLRLATIVARRDYLRTVRRRGYIFGTLLLPIGFLALFGLSAVLGGGTTTGPITGTSPIVIVDASSVDLSTVETPGAVRIMSEAEAEAALRAGEIHEFYRVPATWPTQPDVERVTGGSSAFSLGDAQRREEQTQLLAATLRAGLLLPAGVPPETVTRVIVPVRIQAVTLDDAAATSDAAMVASAIVPFAFTLLFVMSIFITSGYLLQSVTEEKENRVVEILLSSVPSLPLMAGKIIGLGAAGLTQVLIWIAAALVALPLIGSQVGGLGDLAISPAMIILAVVYFVLGYLAFGAVFAAIGAIAPGNREAQQYSGFFGFVAVIPIIFSSLFLTDLQSPVVTVLAIIPVTATAAMLMILALSPTVPVGLVVLSLVSLTVFVVLATIASARVFRATLLLYGVRPSIGRIVSAILARD